MGSSQRSTVVTGHPSPRVRGHHRPRPAAAVALLLVSLLAGAVSAQEVEGPSLQELADVTPSGGTLIIPAGAHEGTVTIDRPMNIEADVRASIDGGTGPALVILAGPTWVRNLTLRSDDSALLMSGAPHVYLENIVVDSPSPAEAEHVEWTHIIEVGRAEAPDVDAIDGGLVWERNVGIHIVWPNGTGVPNASIELFVDGTRVNGRNTDSNGWAEPMLIPNRYEVRDILGEPVLWGVNRSELSIDGRRLAEPLHPRVDELTVSVAPPPTPIVGGAPWLVVAGIAAVLVVLLAAFIALQGYQPFRWWTLRTFGRLYRRRARKQILETGIREALYGRIEQTPGVHLRLLQREHHIRSGTLLYHLQQLERAGHIRSENDGIHKRFYPTDKKAPAATASLVSAQVLAYVEVHPATTDREVALAVGHRESLVHYHVQRLIEAGKLFRRERAGTMSIYPMAAAYDDVDADYDAAYVPPNLPEWRRRRTRW